MVRGRKRPGKRETERGTERERKKEKEREREANVTCISLFMVRARVIYIERGEDWRHMPL